TAPEQILCDNEEINEQADIYSLGAILFTVLTGKPPWLNEDLTQTLKDTLTGDPSILEDLLVQASAPKSLIPVCLKALSPEKKNRYESVDEFKNEVVAYLSGFATLAEEASYFKMLYLLIRRHKVSSMLSIVFLIFLSMTFSFYQNRLQQEQVKILKLNKSKALVLLDQASRDYKNFKIEDALSEVNRSLALAELSDAKSLLTRILIVKGEYKKAKTVFEEVGLEEDVYDRFKHVFETVDLNSTENVFSTISNELLEEHLPGLVFFMVKYHQLNFSKLDKRLESAEKLMKKFNGRGAEFQFKEEKSGLSFKGNERVGRLMPLVDLPLVKIDLSRGVLYDISSLKGMNSLKHLDLSDTYVEKLEALDGLELDYLSLRNTCVVDLAPLRNTKVKKIDLRGLKLKYLTSLLNMKNIEKILIDEERYTSYKDKRELNALKAENRLITEKM
ncbi:MAG: hypothetical protein NE330_06100, partial [Lentisphaeraceae bacterium]|nr:hypothetical protein [Lentisphaeraceae bacterium]